MSVKRAFLAYFGTKLENQKGFHTKPALYDALEDRDIGRRIFKNTFLSLDYKYNFIKLGNLVICTL